MNIISSYKAKIKDLNHCFVGTIHIYNEAASFLLDVCQKEQTLFEGLSNLKSVALMEKLTLTTEKRPSVPYDFNKNLASPHFLAKRKWWDELHSKTRMKGGKSNG